MRRKFIPRIEVTRSSKVNLNIVKELGLNKPNIRKKSNDTTIDNI
jgi:hypothetical protein